MLEATEQRPMNNECPLFSWVAKENVVEEFSAERQRAIISRDHYLTTEGEAGSGDSLPILHRTHSDPVPRLETVQSHFQTEGENWWYSNLWIMKLSPMTLTSFEKRAIF